MNNENFHRTLKVPPLAHALHKWDPETRVLSYEYNGEDIITIPMPESEDAGFRHGSDGTMMSIAYTQQIYVMAEKPMWVTITFALSADSVCMRPERAGQNWCGREICCGAAAGEYDEAGGYEFGSG